MPYGFQPDLEKTREAIIYVAQKCPGATFYFVLKVLYFAEREHVEKYGRLIFGNRIDVSLPHGPVPEEAYDLVNSKRYTGDTEGFEVQPSRKVVAHREPNFDLFSDSELDCLDENLYICRLSFTKVKRMSHDLSYRAARGYMTIEDFTLGMKNRDEILEHLADPFP